ncbi:MAG: TonB-dependent receptor [Bryobacteraceae bacterium]
MTTRILSACRRAACGLVVFATCVACAADSPQRPAQDGSAESALFEELPVVEAASLHAQTLQEAPANVTVITRLEIRKFGYRTLAEALANVRGFYVTEDGSGYFVGVRGFSLLSDYNTRFLVMINGHVLTDDVYGSMYMFGQDFGLDMDLVERIEVIRGPSSALYGSNGVFATVNLVTRSPVEEERIRVSTESGSLGGEKVLFSASTYLGRGANLLISGSAFRSSGRAAFFPELGQTATGISAERGYHTFANLIWRNWSIMASFNDHQVTVPTGWYGAVFGDRNTRSEDVHNFVEAAYTRAIGTAGHLRWRIYYDQFRYRGRYDYPLEDGVVEDNRDLALGDWAGTQFSYAFTVPRVGLLTVGAEVNFDLRNVQQNYAVAPAYHSYLDVSARDVWYGLFAQQEWNLSKTWTAYLGARFDDSKNHSAFVSPRVALVYRPTSTTAFKFLYGRAFRNPSAYETFYDDGSLYLRNLSLQPERAHTLEIAWERKLGQRVELTASAYQYRVAGLIESVTTESGLFQYQNISRARASGVELELRSRPARWLETSASLSVQRARNQTLGQTLVNSPGRIAQFHATVPLANNRLTLSPALRYLSSRLGADRGRVPSVFIADATAATHHLHRDFDFVFGVRNLLGHRYSDPLSPEHLTRELPLPGRTAFIKLIWQHE